MRTKSWVVPLLAALLVPAGLGGLRANSWLAREPAPLVQASLEPRPARPFHEASKRTVVVLLGSDVTEITDMLGPYEMFARTGLYNVYAVAASPASTTLTGGLRVRPHYTFQELDTLLGGVAPAIVVAPNLPNVRADANRPVVDWVRKSAEAGATMLSWCAGAAVLAEAGLLDGRTATSHWGDLARLEDEYPNVEWSRGVRWIDHGSIVTSAGITSGIDATLRLLTRTEGEAVARELANELGYPHFHYALEPSVEQYEPRTRDAVLFINAAFQPLRQRLGLSLYEGVGELDVSTLYDAHAAAGVAEVRAVAAEPGLVKTAHGLWLEPALVAPSDESELGSLDRLIAPGRGAAEGTAALANALRATAAPAIEYVHVESGDRFSLEPTLEDLAREGDVATATFAARRLEYRSPTLRLEGRRLPYAALAALGALVLGAALLVRKLLRLLPSPRSRTRLR